jgi:hypothetical protein
MGATICGSTAYQYWRIPPIVKLLAVGSSDNPMLPKLTTEHELTALRLELAERLPFNRLCSVPYRTQGPDLRVIRETSELIALCADPPIELLARNQNQKHSCAATNYSLWRSNLPAGSCRQITFDLDVTSPAFTMLQLASRSSLARTVLLASELCGNYAVYHAPQPMRAQLERMARRGDLHMIDGWQPCLTSGGKLTDLWMRPPIATIDELEDMVAKSESRCGRRALEEAIRLVKPFASSPFETQAGVLLGFSRRRGGEGFDDFSFNEKVELTPQARLLGQRSFCLCDLYWPDGLDVECQSATFHDNQDSYISDADRISALSLVGVTVLPLTYAQLRDVERFDAFADAVARVLDRRHGEKTPLQATATQRLRKEVFVNWWKLPYS